MVVVSIILIVIVLIAALLSDQSKKSKKREQALLAQKQTATSFTNRYALELVGLVEKVNEPDGLLDYYKNRDRMITILKQLAEVEQYVNPHPCKPLPSVVLVQMDDVYDAQVEDIIKKTYEKAEHEAQTYGSSCSTHRYSSSFMTETSKYLDRMSEVNKKYVEECHNKLLQIEDTTNFIKDKATEAKVLSRRMNESRSLSEYFTCRDKVIELFKQLIPVENDITQYQMNPLPSVMLKQIGDSTEQDVHSAIQRASDKAEQNMQGSINRCAMHNCSNTFMSDVNSYRDRISDSNENYAIECFDRLQQRENDLFYDEINKAEKLRIDLKKYEEECRESVMVHYAHAYIQQRKELVDMLIILADVEKGIDPFPMKPLPSEILREMYASEDAEIGKAVKIMYGDICWLMMNISKDYKLLEYARNKQFSKLLVEDFQLCQKETVISPENLKIANGYVKDLERLEREILRLGENHVSNIASELRKINEKLSAVSGKIEETDGMEGHVFEYWCADLLEKSGFYDVEVTQGSGDQGVDITAVKDEIHYAIQCKCYSSDIGNKPIQEVYAGKEMYQCQVGVVITNSYFTTGAKQLAEKTRVLLWDRDKLSKMLEKVTPAVENDVATTESFSTDAKAIGLDDIQDLLKRETAIKNSSESVPKSKDKSSEPRIDVTKFLQESDYNGVEDTIERAIELVVQSGQASTNFLQRRLKLGYARAARTMDELESMGIVGPADGAKPRQVLMTKAQWMERRAMIGAGAGGQSASSDSDSD